MLALLVDPLEDPFELLVRSSTLVLEIAVIVAVVGTVNLEESHCRRFVVSIDFVRNLYFGELRWVEMRHVLDGLDVAVEEHRTAVLLADNS